MSASAGPPYGDHSKEKKSKWRLSSVFNKDDTKNTSQNQGHNTHNQEQHPHSHDGPGDSKFGQGNHGQNSLAPELTRDSAYGGSETTTTDTSPNPSTTAVPTISAGQAEEQGATVHTKTDSRGRTITTTTTTVVTTTTTTEGDSLMVPAGEEVIVRREERTTRSKSADYREPTNHGAGNEPSIPARNAMRNKSPHGGHLAPHHDAPPIEAPASPSSPSSHQNFSYPGRQVFGQNGRRSSLDQQRTPQNSGRPRPPVEPAYGQTPVNYNQNSPQNQNQPIPPSLQAGNAPERPASGYIAPLNTRSSRDTIGQPQSGFAYNTPSQNSSVQSTIGQNPMAHNSPAQPGTPGYPQRTSTAQSIRTAAAGIHGAGEALRGALNSNVARKTGGTPEEIARYDAIAQRGRQEVQTGQFVKMPPPIPEVPTPPVEAAPEKKRGGLMKNVLRKKSPARNA